MMFLTMSLLEQWTINWLGLTPTSLEDSKYSFNYFINDKLVQEPILIFSAGKKEVKPTFTLIFEQNFSEENEYKQIISTYEQASWDFFKIFADEISFEGSDNSAETPFLKFKLTCKTDCSIEFSKRQGQLIPQKYFKWLIV